jgi:PadR family transcriptional regulator PadR
MIRVRELDVLMALHPVEWRYGYQILELVVEAQGIQRKWGGGSGSLYPILYRLELAGHVEAKWGDDSEIRAGARRRYYRLTSGGYRRRIELESSETDPGMLPQPA